MTNRKCFCNYGNPGLVTSACAKARTGRAVSRGGFGMPADHASSAQLLSMLAVRRRHHDSAPCRPGSMVDPEWKRVGARLSMLEYCESGRRIAGLPRRAEGVFRSAADKFRCGIVSRYVTPAFSMHCTGETNAATVRCVARRRCERCAPECPANFQVQATSLGEFGT